MGLGQPSLVNAISLADATVLIAIPPDSSTRQLVHIFDGPSGDALYERLFDGSFVVVGGGGGGTIGGGGTLNRIPKFTPDGVTLGDSNIFDNGVSIGINTVLPDASSELDIVSTTGGILIPRMTTLQRDAIVAPADGLLIYNTSTSLFNYFDSVIWQSIDSTATSEWLLDGNNNGVERYIGTNNAFDLPIRVNGVEVGVFAIGGNVGFGVAVPVNTFEVQRNQNADTFIKVSNSNAGIASDTGFIAVSDNAEIGIVALSTTNTSLNPSFSGDNILISENATNGLRIFSDNNIYFHTNSFISQAGYFSGLGNNLVLNQDLNIVGPVVLIASAPNTGSLSYDVAIQRFVISENGGAYSPLLTSASISLQAAYVGGQTIGQNMDGITITRTGAVADTLPLLKIENFVVGSTQYGLHIVTNNGAIPQLLEVSTVSNNTSPIALKLYHSVQGAPTGANGIGESIVYASNNDAGTSADAVVLSGFLSDVTNGLEEGTFNIGVVKAGVLTNVASFTSAIATILNSNFDNAGGIFDSTNRLIKFSSTITFADFGNFLLYDTQVVQQVSIDLANRTLKYSSGVTAVDYSTSFVLINPTGADIDLAATSGNSFHIGTDANGTNGMSLLLKAYNGVLWRNGLQYTNVNVGEPNLILLPDLIGNLGIGTSSFGATSVNVVAITNGAAPTTDVADQFSFYSADIVAGNAVPHFRTENGSIIRLFESAAYTISNVTPDRAYDADATTLDEIADVLGTLISDLQATGLMG